MKKILSIILTAALTFTVAVPAFAAETVTAGDVEKVLEKSSLKNNAEDYAYFQQSLEKLGSERIQEALGALDTGQMYPNYTFRYDADTNKDLIQTADASTAKFSDLITYKPEHRAEQTVEYMYRKADEPNRKGMVFIDESMGYTSSGLSMNEEYLMYHPDDLAKIINAEQLGLPNEIKYVKGTFVDFYESVCGNSMILLETDDGEYIITAVHYRDGELSHWLAAPAADIIRYVQGDRDGLLKKSYDNIDMLPAPSFTDTDDESVSLLARLGIVSGYSDGTFKPQNNVTRAEAAKFLADLTMEAYNNVNVYADEDFDMLSSGDRENWYTITDVPDSHWARNYIQYGVREGYISGKEYVGGSLRHGRLLQDERDENGDLVYKETDYTIGAYNFCPEDNVTEIELAKMLVSAIDRYGDEMAKAEGGYPSGYVAVAKRLGIAENASDKPATRLSAARMLNNALDAYVTGDMEDVIFWDDAGNLENAVMTWQNTEVIYNKNLYYSLDDSKVRVRLRGTVTASHDTDETLGEKEIKFVPSEDVKCSNSMNADSHWAGEEITVLMQYDDVKNYLNKECTLYCEEVDGLLTAVMAQPI